MSITDYIEKKHPAGFKGYRVSVMVDGDHRQRYFSTSKDVSPLTQFVLAMKLNAKWLKEKERVNQSRVAQAEQTNRSVYGTGVRGISKRLCYSTDRQGNYVYENLRYVVQGSTDNKLFHKSFPVTEKGWHDAVRYYAKMKGIKKWKHLLTRNKDHG